MESTSNNGQSPSVWGSTQDLASCSMWDHPKRAGQPQNYTVGACELSQSSWDHSHQATIGNKLRRKDLKSCSARKVPLLKEAHVQGRLKFANEHLNDSKEDWETGCGQMRPKSSSLASTRL